jgi:protein TonB
MQTQKNFQEDWLDLLFQHRNKLYGAYELRRNYPRRLTFSLFLLMAGCLLIIAITSLAKKNTGHPAAMQYTDFVIDPYQPDPATPPKPPPPPVATQIRQEIYVVPIIFPDKLVTPEDEMPPIEDLQLANLGTTRIEGVDGNGDGWNEPSGSNGLPANPPHQDAPEETQFTSVQIPAAFPGGMEGWSRYLQRNLNPGYTLASRSPCRKIFCNSIFYGKCRWQYQRCDGRK